MERADETTDSRKRNVISLYLDDDEFAGLLRARHFYGHTAAGVARMIIKLWCFQNGFMEYKPPLPEGLRPFGAAQPQPPTMPPIPTPHAPGINGTGGRRDG